MNAVWTPVTGLDEPTGHPVGIAMGFFGLAIFFVVIFLVMVWVGNQRRRRNGPPPPPTYPLLGKPSEAKKQD